MENVWKGFLDEAKNVINTLNSFPKLFGKLPLGAIAAIGSIVTLIKQLGINLITGFAEVLGNGLMHGMSAAEGQAKAGAENLWTVIKNTLSGKKAEATELGRQLGNAIAKGNAPANNSFTTSMLSDTDRVQYTKNKDSINLLSQVTDNFSARAASVALLN